MKRILSILLMISAVFVITGCEQHDETDVLNVKINGETYSIPLQDNTVVNLITLNTEFDAEFEVENASMFQELRIAGKSATSGFVKVPVEKIEAGVQLPVEYRSGDHEGTMQINTLNANIPTFAVSGKAAAEGDFYLSFVHLRLIMKYDNDGNILYYRCNPDEIGSTNNTGWWDFKKHEIDGQTYYSYHANDPKFSSMVISGFDPGMRVIMDDHYKVLKTIQMVASGPYIHTDDPIDGHDFYMFDLDHYIVSGLVDRTFGDTLLASAYIQEVKDGEVIFDWWSVDHPEMRDMLDEAFLESAGKDYVHFNSIQVLPDGNWLCSFRQISSIMKIERVNETGAFLWCISGRDLPGEQCFSGQHYVRLHGNVLTMFDNGNGHPAQISRPLRLIINPDNGNVIEGGPIVDGGDYFSHACGSVMQKDNHYVVGWGFPDEPVANDRLVIEYDASGNEIFGMRNTGTDLTTNALRCTYRCVKIN